MFGAKYWRATLVGATIQLFKMFCGAVAVNMFSSIIFKSTGIDGKLTNLLIGVANVIGALSSVFLVGRTGRKALFVAGGAIMLTSHILIILGFYFKQDNVVACFLVTFTLAYSISGPVGYIYLTDICLPAGVSIGIFSLNFSLMIQIIIMPIMLYSPNVGIGPTFIALAVITFCSLLFSIFVIKETKGLTDD